MFASDPDSLQGSAAFAQVRAGTVTRPGSASRRRREIASRGRVRLSRIGTVGTYLETERLRLRRFTAADEDDVVALHGDPEVMRYLGKPETRDGVQNVTLRRWLTFHARDPAFGYFAAVEKDTGTFLGWFLFRPPLVDDPPPGEIELGYRLHTAAWGRGFATEGSIALVRKGFTELGVQRVVATTMAVNRGSRRVLEKVGLRYVRTFHLDRPDPLEGSEHGEVEYALTREEWRRTPCAGAPGPSPATPPR
jgi:RimJ/RimL family protein N-acetyltransferase